MRTAILSDIHGNLEALEAVLAECRAVDIDDFICLGDVVGYGANPNKCVERVQGLTDCVICGNHDHAAVGLADLDFFNSYARDAALWTAKQLSKENADYLRNLPLSIESEEAIFVHSTPHQPEAWEYVFNSEDAEDCLAQTDRMLCFVGHSHVAFIWKATGNSGEMVRSAFIAEASRFVINVGSVGQPRDHDPRAAFSVWDRSAKKIQINRTEYDISSAQSGILAAGLPSFLAERLALGR